MIKNSININHQRDITAYANVAYPLFFILAEPKLKHWYYESFINIYSQVWFDKLFRIDYLDSSRFFGDILDRRSFKITDMKDINIIDFIVENIDNGFGLNIFTVDEYYLPESKKYQSTHNIHEIFIYGYDNEEKKLLVSGYGKSGAFGDFTLDYDNFIIAFNVALSNPPEYLVDALHVIRSRHFFQGYQFDINRFYTEFKNFLFSIPDSKKVYFSIASADEVTYGFQVYIKMLEYIKKILDGDNSVHFNFIPIHFISEHSKVLLDRFNFIAGMYDVNSEYTDLIKQYSLIVRELNLIRMTYLKVALGESDFTSMTITKNKSALNDIYEKYISIINKEKILLKNIYESLTIFIQTYDVSISRKDK